MLRLALLAALASSPALAETIACSVTYGGDTMVFAAKPAADPYRVPAIPVGSHFLFRVVVESEPPAAKVYVYAEREGGPIPLHQATHPMPAATASPYGFTGLNFVYEPFRDGELQYWCRPQPEGEEQS